MSVRTDIQTRPFAYLKNRMSELHEMLTVTVVRSSCDENAMCYVFPVLQKLKMTHQGTESKATSDFYDCPAVKGFTYSTE